MRVTVASAGMSIGLVSLLIAAATANPPGAGSGTPDRRAPRPVLYKAQPIAIAVAELGPGIDTATVTDVAVADFNGDGRSDVAVAWFATDNDDLAANLRMLSIYFNEGTSLYPAANVNLYVLNAGFPALSVFRYGTGAIGVGDFDGDGDLDLAVTPFYGDELWLIENLGGGEFAQHLKYMFGFNSSSVYLTPPGLLAVDFDSDGRDELTYLADPIYWPDGAIVHFWRTGGALADMYRTDWESFGGSLAIKYTRALTSADFNGDGRPDLCFSGTTHPAYEMYPVFTAWYNFDPATGYFSVHDEFPSIVCSDVVNVRSDLSCPAGVLLTDLNGTTMQYWANARTGAVDFVQTAEVTGYAGLAPNRGMAGAVADVNGDGCPDLVTKQKLAGATDANQIEITLSSYGGTTWTRVSPTPIDATGFQMQQNNQHLRPRNLAVADLWGNTLPEIVAGFAAAITPTGRVLRIAIWQNSCLGDVTLDGRTDAADIGALEAALGTCRDDPLFSPDADLDKDGCVTPADLALLMHDLGCTYSGDSELRPGDLNCDGLVNMADIAPFVLALSDEAAYHAQFPDCNWLNADCNADGAVNFADVNPFVALLGG